MSLFFFSAPKDDLADYLANLSDEDEVGKDEEVGDGLDYGITGQQTAVYEPAGETDEKGGDDYTEDFD